MIRRKLSVLFLFRVDWNNQFSWILTAFILIFIIGCKSNSTVNYTRYIYRCCSSNCIDPEHLLTEESFDKEGRITVIRHYYPEEPHHLSQLIRYEYQSNKKSFVYDSTEFTITQTTFHYNNERLTKSVTIRSQRSILNDPADTIPHTRWVVYTDTIVHLFEYPGNRSIKEVQLENGDTLTMRETFLSPTNKPLILLEGNSRTEYTYSASDSLVRTDTYNHSVSGSNITASDYEDSRWRLIKSIEYIYDTLNRKTEELHYDDIDILMYHYRYGYNAQGRLISIRDKDNNCDTLIYKAR